MCDNSLAMLMMYDWGGGVLSTVELHQVALGRGRATIIAC